MAEIKIEKKTPVWPWILAAIIIAALLYFFVFATDDDEIDDTTTTEQVTEGDTLTNNTYDNTTTTANTNTTAVSEYTVYINDPQMGLDHEYANGAINRLISAVEAKASEANVDIQADLDRAREKAQGVTENPYNLTHADMIKEAGEIITRAMKTVQTQKYPNMNNQVSEVETALNQIKVKQPTLEQKDAVKNFFDKAGNALTSMK